jgi:hypothetical protein
VVRLREVPRGTNAFRPWGTSGLAFSSAIVKLFGGRCCCCIVTASMGDLADSK